MDRHLRLFLVVLATTMAAAAVGLPYSPAAAVQASHSVIVSADPVDWSPNVLDGSVKAIAQVGNEIVVGGNFTQVQDVFGGPVLTRNNLLAFDATTGAIDMAFDPEPDARVEALVPSADGTAVFVGGLFNNISGTSTKKLAKLDLATGLPVQGFKTSVNGSVKDLTVRGNTLYIAGTFTQVKGTPHSLVAALDATTGAPDPNFNVQFTVARKNKAYVAKLDVTPDASKLIAIGNFTRIDGLDRWQIGMVDLTTTPASVANWETDRYKPTCASRFDTYLRDVDFSPDGSYLVVVTTGAFWGGAGAGVLCDTAARWETSATGTALQPTWVDYTGGDTLYSVAVTGAAVYVGGHERWANNPFAGDAAGPGAVRRQGIGALDPINGVPLSWNPTRARGLGAFALVGTPDGLWVGSDTTRLDHEYHARIGMFPVTGGEARPPADPGALPGLFYQMAQDGTLVARYFDGTTFGSPTIVSTGIDWSHARGGMMLSGYLYDGWDTGEFIYHAFDGSSVGNDHSIKLYNLQAKGFDVQLSNCTGMFFDNGRMYYTVAGDSKMYYRYFTPESNIVGAELFIASGNGDGFDWRNVSGMTMAGGMLYFASSNGDLNLVPWENGRPSSSITAISGPSIDGIDWKGSEALFVLSP